MEYFTHILLGIIVTFIGLLAPGMLNMTSLKVALERGEKSGQQFALGASVIIFIQALIALFFAKKFSDNPNLLDEIETAGTVVFFALSVFFFIKTRSKFKLKKQEGKFKNYFFQGLAMSSMNMLKIPYYLAISTYLGAQGYMLMEKPYHLSFAVGGGMGAYFLFLTYIIFAKVIHKRANFIARNINYILCLLFLFLGVMTLVVKN